MSGLSLASTALCRIVRSGSVWLCDDDAGISRTPTYALAQDGRGHLWLGSEDGPLQFDGLALSSPAGLADLAGCVIRAATVADAGLWIGTQGAGLACIDLGSVPYRVTAHLTQATGLPSNAIRALCVDGQRRLWAATDAGVVVVDDNTEHRCYTVDDGLPSDNAWALCRDHQGRIWVGTAEGLVLVVSDAVAARSTIRLGGIYSLCCDREGQVWVGTLHGQLLRANVGPMGTVELHPVHTGDGCVRTLCPDRHGRLWVGTSSNVLVVHEDAVRRTIAMDDGLPAKGVWSLCCDDDGRIWAGASTGLVLVENTPSPIRAVPAAAAPAGPVFAFAPDRRGRMWVAAETGVTALDRMSGRSVTLPELPAEVAGDTVWALQADRHGRLWAGTQRDGLLCVDPCSGELHARFALANDVPSLCLVGDRQVWAGMSGRGLVCVDTVTLDVVHQIGPEQGLPHTSVQGLQTDRQGRLWVGTWSGWLSCIEPVSGMVVATLRLSDDASHRPVTDMASDADGLLWVGTYGGGLACVDPARCAVVRVVTDADGLPSNLIYACGVDAGGRIWMGTRRGVARYSPRTGQCAVLGRSMGLPHEECNSRAMYLDERGQLWVGTVQGIAVIDTGKIVDDVPPSPVYLRQLTVMGHEREVVPGMEIDDTHYDLAFDYGAVDFTAARQIMYRVQLVGLDESWSRPTPQRSMRYTNLGPGDYTFRVAARNWGGRWSDPLEVRFRVTRNRAAQEMEAARQRAEEAEAAVRIRNDVLGTVAHDLRSPLAGIMGHADLLLRRLERDAPPTQEWLRAQADALRSGARRMSSMVEEILDVARLDMGERLALHLDPVDVAALVRRVADTLQNSAGRDLALIVETPSTMVVQGDAVRLERVLENVINNAIKYSPRDQPVRVAVQSREDGVTVDVQDSGVGIPADELPHIFTPFYRASTSTGVSGTGLGLAGARTIVDQHGGQVTVQSQVGLGTTVTVLLPYRPVDRDHPPVVP